MTRLDEILYTSAVLRAREVEKQTGWPANLLVTSENVSCELLEAIGLRLDVDEYGVFDVTLDGEFTFAEIVDDWRAEATAVFDLMKQDTVAGLARKLGVSRPTAYKYLAEGVTDRIIFHLIGEKEFTYRGIWELRLD